MKTAKTIFIVAFFIVIAIPICFFNLEKNSVSKIDNRQLQEITFPINSLGGFKTELGAYINDRIGFREEMIAAYTKLNMAVYNELVHPQYEYGKEGFVFSKVKREIDESEYLNSFVAYLVKIKNYSEERGVPFIFVLEPKKSTVYNDKLINGYNYSNDNLEYLRKALEENNIEYVDNAELLSELKEDGEKVFNVKYDTNHWNDLGAFYGSNNTLEAVGQIFPKVTKNSLEDYNLIVRKDKYLPTSSIVVNEENHYYIPKQESWKSSTLLEDYASELRMNESYKTLTYDETQRDDLPKGLLFRGSYYNGRTQYLSPHFSELITVHSYQNIIDFEYYFNVFQPEIVVFETVEYTINSGYYDKDLMDAKAFNPALGKLNVLSETMEKEEIEGELTKGEVITNISFDLPIKGMEYAYLETKGNVFDMAIDGNKLKVAISNKDIDTANLKIICFKKGHKYVYKNVSI